MATVIENETNKESHVPVRTSGSGAKTLIKWVIVLAVLAAIGYEGYRIWEGMQRVESTDDSQIDGTISPVSSRIGGHVLNVLVGDEQMVKAGDVLVQLDRQDLEVALAKAQADLADAEAGLASARNDVPITSIATSSTLTGARSAHEDATVAVDMAQQQVGAAQARLTVAQANVKVAQATQTKTAQDVERYRGLAAKEEISKQTLDQAIAADNAARATVEAQQAAVIEAQQNIATGQRAVEQARAKVRQAESGVEAASSGPEQVKAIQMRAQGAAARVAQMKAGVDQAQLNLSYATITAQTSGIIGRKAVDAGQNISPGQQLMSIVAIDDVWVTANFKETQLKEMKIGQKADIEVDANGRTYSGKVERISGASGARFSLLPPENATGNYVRVVQRIPVRISIDPGQNGDHALRPGISVTSKVHIR
jgi:membrane fusion protein (multidrug efflux system)